MGLKYMVMWYLERYFMYCSRGSHAKITLPSACVWFPSDCKVQGVGCRV